MVSRAGLVLSATARDASATLWPTALALSATACPTVFASSLMVVVVSVLWAWAAELTNKGYKLDPRALSQETYRITSEGESSAPEEKPVSNLLFLEAGSFEEAVKIAKSHPGARYGTEIEVRAWTRPVALPVPAK